MKDVVFMGDSLVRIRAFPAGVRQDIGFQIDTVQRGKKPDDWKPVNSVGKGVREIRTRDASGQYRVVYLANFKDAVHMLHAFQKKTQRTRRADLDLARERLKQVRRRYG